MKFPLLAVAATILAACSPLMSSQACERTGAGPCASIADVEVLDRTTGERLPVYWHDGQRWIAGTPGHRYAVSLRNMTYGRVLGVVAVDGVNAISGETADWNQGGYVLAPWQAFDVLGWRKSDDRVADFVFTAVDNSYAARTGRPENAGVIGVALFREAPPPVSMYRPEAPYGARRSESAGGARADESADSATAPQRSMAQAPMAKAEQGAAVRQQRLGTGHGQSETSVVSSTSFERAQPQPDQLFSIRYDRRERLLAMGIIPVVPGPHPFPGSADSGFVPDPPTAIR